MAKQDIDIGVEGNDGTGDSIRESFRKVNENFNELYAVFGAGGQISFTNLGDTPNVLEPNKTLLVNDDGSALEFVEFASDSAANPLADDSIQISYDVAGKIILSTSFRALSQDLSPTLGGPLDADGRAIANVAITQEAVNEFNASQPGSGITIDDLVITKGYADNRYIAGDLPIRVDDEPADASEYTLVVESYTDGNIVVSDHGYDRTINGTPFAFRAEDTDPANLVSGTTYYLRYYSTSQLSIHRTREDATVQSQSVADGNRIFVTAIIAPDDEHVFVDAAFDPNLQGFFLSNEAMPRKSIVRRQGDTMTGALILHDSPGELSGLATSREDLQAATKFYVDNTSYSSPTNLFVSTSGDDMMRGVPAGKEGTSWSYAYRTINAAARRAEEIMKASEAEPGPYMQTITRDNGAAPADVVSVGINAPLFAQARNLIDQNREFVIREISAYLKFKYPEFDYNVETCERDLGLILDAIAFDINRSQSLTEATANSLTRIAAERYYASSSGKVAITRQLTQTLDAINTARDIVSAILLNRPFRQTTISNITQALIPTVTTNLNHGLASGNIIVIKNVVGMTQLNENFYYVKVTGNRTLELFSDAELLFPVSTLGFDAYSTGGIIGLVYQTDEKQFFDVGDDAGVVERQAAVDKFNLITNILQNGVDAGANVVYGKTYKVVVNNGGLTSTDQGRASNRDILPGKILVGKISGAQGRIVSYTPNSGTDNNQDVIEVHLLKARDFAVGEDLEFGNFVNKSQVTIFVESGQYEEDYPIKIANNVSLKGDEFRRVIIRPKDRISQSPWVGTYIYRDLEFDGLTISNGGARFYNQTNEWQGYFGYHYLSNPEKTVNTGISVSNAGEYFDAAAILRENKKFIQEETINYIDNNANNILYDKNIFRDDLEAIINAISYDIVLGTNYNQVLYGLKFQRSKSIYLDPYLKELWVLGLTEARRLVTGLPALISSTTARNRATAAFNEIIDIIENGVVDTNTSANAVSLVTVATTNSGRDNARLRIQANKEFIAQEALAYIKSLAPRKYIDEATRLRDYRDFVDALAYDTLYGGNSAVTEFAKDLFVDDELRLEIVTRQESVQTFTHLKSVIEDLVLGTAVTPTTGNPQTPSYTGSNATQTEADIVNLYLGIVETQINNNNLLNLPTITYPSLVGLDSTLIDAKSNIDGSVTTVIDGAITIIDNNVVIDYNRAKCRRDVGLIVDALIEDLEIGGDEFSTEVQGQYFTSYIQQYNNGGFGGQENLTKGAIENIAVISNRLFQGSYSPSLIEQNPADSDYVAPDFKYGTGETGTGNIVNNLVDKIIFAFDRKYNPPLRNDQMDCFLMNDATILRNMTVQGHGGFLCVLDPDGQILTKSPYVQTGSSFSKSINSKIFGGGMFVDAYVGNLPAYIPTTIDVGNGPESGKINNFVLWIRSEEGQGLFVRPPQLPCPFYVEGRRYQVNAISDYDQGNGWCKIYLDATSNSGTGYDENQFEEDTSNISRTIYLQTAGNRSMLGNDFTQINDLGYALVTNNGAFSEMVSMFTYYCQAAYYAKNGSEIRSLNGSNGYGNFGLVAEGADPNEIPDQVTLEDNMVAPVKAIRWYDGIPPAGQFVNIETSPSIYVTDFPIEPQPNSILTINHPTAGSLQYRISVVRDLGDGTASGDIVNTSIRSITNIGAADPARTAGSYAAVTAVGGNPEIPATFNVTINGSGEATISVNSPGVGYIAGTNLVLQAADIGGTGSNLAFTIENVYGNDGTTTLPSGVYSNKVYQLQITGTPAGENGDFFGQLQEDVLNGDYLEYRSSETFIFNSVRDQGRLVTRPSTAINFDESDNITYRSIAFSSFDSAGEPLDSDSISTTFEIPYDDIEFVVNTSSLGGGNGGNIGDTSIAILPEAEGFVLDPDEISRLIRDIYGNQPPETLNYDNAYDLVARNLRFVQEEVIAYVNATNPSLVYDEKRWYADFGAIVVSVAKDLLFGGNASSVYIASTYYENAVFQLPADQKSMFVAAILKAKEIVGDYIIPQVLWTPVNTNGYTQDASGVLPEAGSAVAAEGLFDIIANYVNTGTGLTTNISGYAGGMIFNWGGRTHQVIDYVLGLVSTEATIKILSAPIYDVTTGGTGISQAFATSKVLRAGLTIGATAEITINISLCRATGHDFTQIGTGGFNDSNYPNVILGDPVNPLAPYYTDSPNATSAQVWERRKGRVFWMSTDQYGFFRVGKFFEVDQGQGSIKFSGEIGITGANALGFKKGVTIDEFSIDDTMADESDGAVPVEKAIVSYINKRLGRDKNDNAVGGRIGPGYLPLSGTPEMEGELQMGNNRITNLATPDSGTDAATKSYVDGKILGNDNYNALRNVSANRPAASDLVVYTGLKKIFTTIPEDSSGSSIFEVGDSIRDVSGVKGGVIKDIVQTTDDIIGEFEPGNNIWVIVYQLNAGSPSFNEGETVEGTGGKSSVSATILRGPFDELGHARESTDSVINFTVTRTESVIDDGLTVPIAEINFQIENESIIDADISTTASIAQSKLLMERAGPLAASTGLYGTGNDTGQSSRGLAAFDSDHFTHEIQVVLSGPITANAGNFLYQGTSKGTVVTQIINSTSVLLRTSDPWIASSTILTIAEVIDGVERVATSTSRSVASVNASGYIGLKERSIGFDKLANIATDNVMGRFTPGTGDIEAVPFSTVIDQGFGLEDVDFQDSQIVTLTGQVLTFASPVTVSNGEILTQNQGGGIVVTGTVQGKVVSETKVTVINTTGNFNTASITGDVNGGIGSPIGVSVGVSLNGSVLVKQDEGVYGTVPISTVSSGNTMARRTATGSLQANSYIIGGSTTNEVLSESGGTLTFKTPAQGTILTSNGGSVSLAPFVNMPGSLNVGNTGVTNEGNAQGNVAALTGKGFVSSTWMYSNFIEALDTKETNNTTGISFGGDTTYTSAAAQNIVVINQNTESIVITPTVVSIKRNFNVGNTQFTVDASTGNVTVNGNLTVNGTTSSGSSNLDSLTLSGDLVVNGDTALGDATSDTIGFIGRVSTSILPSATGKNLGSSTLPWSTVYGNTFSGTATTAKYADLAENYLADADYEPGTVVVLGGEAEVTITNVKGDRRVAGVVSTEPAHLMNSHLQGDHVVALALQGRVPCKVLGKVNKGDILVTSAIPGYAIVDNEPKYGAIIGKAVGSKDDDGKGVVEVLVGKA